MKQVSSWMAAMMSAFWGTMLIVGIARVLPEDYARIFVTFIVPPGVVLSLLAAGFFLRRRARNRNVPDSLEEIRRCSRQHMATEPQDAHYVLRPSRKPCGSRTGDRRNTCANAPPVTVPVGDDTPPENRRTEV